jgi:hypothetical protein
MGGTSRYIEPGCPASNLSSSRIAVESTAHRGTGCSASQNRFQFSELVIGDLHLDVLTSCLALGACLLANRRS